MSEKLFMTFLITGTSGNYIIYIFMKIIETLMVRSIYKRKGWTSARRSILIVIKYTPRIKVGTKFMWFSTFSLIIFLSNILSA